MNIKWQEKITNSEVLERAEHPSIHTILRKRRLIGGLDMSRGWRDSDGRCRGETTTFWLGGGETEHCPAVL